MNGIMKAKCMNCEGVHPLGQDCPHFPINAVMQPIFAIGQQFQTRGKHPRLCTVTDILKTYNAKGELVKIRYVATHEFMGQTITDSDVIETTIAMGLE